MAATCTISNIDQIQLQILREKKAEGTLTYDAIGRYASPIFEGEMQGRAAAGIENPADRTASTVSEMDTTGSRAQAHSTRRNSYVKAKILQTRKRASESGLVLGRYKFDYFYFDRSKKRAISHKRKVFLKNLSIRLEASK